MRVLRGFYSCARLPLPVSPAMGRALVFPTPPLLSKRLLTREQRPNPTGQAAFCPGFSFDFC